MGLPLGGDGDDDSDVDLLLVRTPGVDEDDETWAIDVEGLANDVLTWTGNELNVVDYDPEQVAEPSSGLRALLASVEVDGVLLHGTPLRTLRRRLRTVPP